MLFFWNINFSFGPVIWKSICRTAKSTLNLRVWRYSLKPQRMKTSDWSKAAKGLKAEMKAQIIRSQRPRCVPSCSSVKSFRQSVSTALFFVLTSPTDRCCFLKAHSHGAKATETKNDFTIKVHATLEVAYSNVHVNRSICCHRTHCWHQEKIDIVAPCELAFRPIHTLT